MSPRERQAFETDTVAAARAHVGQTEHRGPGRTSGSLRPPTSAGGGTSHRLRKIGTIFRTDFSQFETYIAYLWLSSISGFPDMVVLLVNSKSPPNMAHIEAQLQPTLPRLR